MLPPKSSRFTPLACSIALVLVASLAPPTRAEQHPDRAAIQNTSQLPASAKGSPFICGTYAGNQVEARRQVAWNQKILRDVAAGKTTKKAAALDYVNDDVWIVEDDGTLLIDGVNLFDTDFATFRFTPSGSAYDLAQIAFSFDSNYDGAVVTGDDGSVLLNMGFSFPFGGSNWTDVHVGGNGLVSFGALPNPAGFYDPNDFFSNTPQINPFYADLNPAAAGSVQQKSYSNRRVITWLAVPEFGTLTSNTVQLTLWDNGDFDISYNGIGSTSAANGAPIYTGFSQGSGSLELISFSDDPPYGGSPGNGIYEEFTNITNPIVNTAALISRFISNFGDIFFQVTFFTNFQQTMGGFANELNISNDVTGIGLPIFDNSGSFGSAGVLESRCNMNQLSVWPDDPTTRFFGDGNNFLTIMGQESGHRWGAFLHFQDGGGNESNLILGRADAHWSYFVDNDHSSLEGGNWDLISGSNYSCPTEIDFFPSIDEYTFGLRLPEEVKDIYYLDSPSNNLASNRSQGTPSQFDVASGTPVAVTIDDIIAFEGPRTPSRDNEEHDLRHGFILLVESGNVPTQAELDKIALFRSSWEDYFELSCDGRLTCNTSLTSEYDVAWMKGNVTDALSGDPIEDLTSVSVERGFNQEVPGGGYYSFRYQANATTGAAETITVTTSSPGYWPDTCNVSIAYGDTLCKDIELFPVPTSVTPGTPLPLALYQNAPNPFNPSTVIRYDTSVSENVRLTVFNAAGKQVRSLVNSVQPAGDHRVSWNGQNDAGNEVSSGIYFYKLETGDNVVTRKMTLLK